MHQGQLPQSMEDYLAFMETGGRGSTAPSYRRGLRRFMDYLAETGTDLDAVTTDTLIAFRTWLLETYRKPDGQPITQGTVGTWLSGVKGFYRHLYRRGELAADPAAKVKLPRVRRDRVRAGVLSVQEATAFVQTQARLVADARPNSTAWAVQHRNLTMLCLALATGRRCSSLRDLRVEDLDPEEREVRIDWEKGSPGRVLPVAKWAMDVAVEHVAEARPRLLAIHDREDHGWLFVGLRTDRPVKEYLTRLVQDLHPKVCEANDDLEELPAKLLTSHSLRVTFATSLMFLNGADIRTVNDLLLHKQLSTTAQYTPLELDDLRRAMRAAHPRA